MTDTERPKLPNNPLNALAQLLFAENVIGSIGELQQRFPLSLAVMLDEARQERSDTYRLNSNLGLSEFLDIYFEEGQEKEQLIFSLDHDCGCAIQDALLDILEIAHESRADVDEDRFILAWLSQLADIWKASGFQSNHLGSSEDGYASTAYEVPNGLAPTFLSSDHTDDFANSPSDNSGELSDDSVDGSTDESMEDFINEAAPDIDSIILHDFSSWSEETTAEFVEFLWSVLTIRFLDWHAKNIQAVFEGQTLEEIIADVPEEDIAATRHLRLRAQGEGEAKPADEIWDPIVASWLARYKENVPPKFTLANIGPLLLSIVEANTPVPVVFIPDMLSTSPVSLSQGAQNAIEGLGERRSEWTALSIADAVLASPDLPKPWSFPLDNSQVPRLLAAMINSGLDYEELHEFAHQDPRITKAARAFLLEQVHSSEFAEALEEHSEEE